jgi:hypothetical protein
MAVSIVEIPIKTGAASVVPPILENRGRRGTLFMGSQRKSKNKG